MKQMTFSNYLLWRQHVLNDVINPADYTKKGKRGQYRPFDCFSVLSQPFAETEYVHNTKLRDIIKAETDLIWEGATNDVTDFLYENDVCLLDAYKRLNVQNLIDNDESRNNVSCSIGTCLAWWQFYNKKLYVLSRSMDLQRAGLSDYLVVNRICHKLNAEQWSLLSLIPHLYLNRETIARRSPCTNSNSLT